MLDDRDVGADPAAFPRALALAVALGLSAALGSCADIHPASDDSDTGMMNESNEGAVHERDEEEQSEHVEPGQERPR